MFVGLLRKNDATCVCICELLETSLLLKEVDQISCSEFYKKRVKLTCLVNKGLLMLHLKSDYIYHIFT